MVQDSSSTNIATMSRIHHPSDTVLEMIPNHLHYNESSFFSPIRPRQRRRLQQMINTESKEEADDDSQPSLLSSSISSGSDILQYHLPLPSHIKFVIHNERLNVSTVPPPPSLTTTTPIRNAARILLRLSNTSS